MVNGRTSGSPGRAIIHRVVAVRSSQCRATGVPTDRAYTWCIDKGIGVFWVGLHGIPKKVDSSVRPIPGIVHVVYVLGRTEAALEVVRPRKTHESTNVCLYVCARCQVVQHLCGCG